MKDLKQYLVESEYRATHPVAGDNFVFEFDDGTEVATYILETSEDEILVAANPETIAVMEQWCGLSDILLEDEDFSQCEAVLDEDQGAGQVLVKAADDAPVDTMDEAEYRGRKVTLNKPTRGDVKKFKVYVKDPKTGNVKKVNFGHGGTSAKRAGQKTMKIKKSNPARRKSFRARHHCENPGPKTKARYWSCRAW
jgi:hypothetical protein